MTKELKGSIINNGKVYKKDQLLTIIQAIKNQISLCVSENSVIGIALPRILELFAAILSAFELGIPFVLIDLDFPSDRQMDILNKADVDILITSDDFNVNWICDKRININDLNSNQPQQNNICLNNEVVYILFTLGSTGEPKGVKVLRNSFYNFFDGMIELIDFSPEKCIACLTTVSFDIFFLESIVALYNGLKVVLANENEQRNPRLMAKLIQNNNVDMIQMTPSRMQLLLNHDKELACLKSVKEIMIGGEPFPLGLLKALQEKTTAKIYNMYGPTETTIWSTVSNLTNKN